MKRVVKNSVVAIVISILLTVTVIWLLPAKHSGIRQIQDNIPATQVSEDAWIKQSSRVEFYVERLCRYDREYSGTERRPFTQYVSYLFRVLQSESGPSTSQDDIRALLVAMGVYFGPDSFEKLLATLRIDSNVNCQASRHVTLAGRRDLLRHFVIAAGLTALFNNELPLNFFEMKEFSDTDKGGTGFSFTDLAANLAGIKFSSYLINQAGPEKLAKLSQPTLQESLFFPSIKGLPEGLTQATFDKNYKSTDSEAYTAVLSDIETRIQALLLYH